MRVTLLTGVHSESSCDEQGVMMLDIVELSRLQFALTAMYHFVCAANARYGVPAYHMETVYVLSGKQIYKDILIALGQVVWYQLLPGWLPV